MKSKITFLLVALSLPAFLSGTQPVEKVDTLYGEDNVTYEEPLVVPFDKPDIKKAAAGEVWPDKITLHYHNDSPVCDKKAFYVWFNGINGEQYAPDVVSQDKKDMEKTFDFNGEFSFAKKRKMFLIIKSNVQDDWNGKSDDTPIDYSVLNLNAGATEAWIIPGEASALEVYATKEESNIDRVKVANFDTWKHISLISTTAPTEYCVYAFPKPYFMMLDSLKEPRKKEFIIKSGTNPTTSDVTFNTLPMKKWSIDLNFTIRPNVQYAIGTKFSSKPELETIKYVAFDDLYKTQRFNTYYEYKGNDLGVTYSKDATTFKVWAPTAGCVRLLLYTNPTGDDAPSGYNMVYQPGGVWAITITGRNLNYMYYNYWVVNSLGINEVTDPYAKACSINGDRGEILDFSQTNPEGWEDVPTKWDGLDGYDIENPNDLSIYETHIRDLTMDETWQGESRRGTYSAFVESGTTYTKDDVTVTTGFDHLREMGMKAVQLEPVFDYDNEEDPEKTAYNWGYNPKNYNCVEGSYATDPVNGESRIYEFKNLVKAFADPKGDQHQRVVMDVVYNHVQSAPGSCFEKLMPRYFFRLTEGKDYYNGSGCGNEVKSEAPMMRKYIVDSLCWWASEYKIKGFRFDLMGLVDWVTLEEARTALYKIDPDIYLFGEGWTGDGSDSGHVDEAYYHTWGTNSWTVYNKCYDHTNKCWLGCFNDSGRNALKGENSFGDAMKGFVCLEPGQVGDKSRTVADMLVGYHTGKGGNPNQCVNYASCHDNFTLFDQMTYCFNNDGSNPYYPGVACAAVATCETAILFSNGIAFIHGGEELFRCKEVSAEEAELVKGKDIVIINNKRISHNSYNLSDKVNSYKWDRKISIGKTETLGYVKAIEKAIKTRELTEKYDYDDLLKHNPFSSSSPMNVWNQGDGSTSVAMKNNDYCFFISGGNNSDIPFDAINYFDDCYCSNPYGEGYTRKPGVGIKLGWATSVCLVYNPNR